MGIGGFIVLIFVGYLFVCGVSGIVVVFGVVFYIIGVIVVVIGILLFELVIVLFVCWCGYDDIGIGMLLGSNLFNGLVIVGVVVSIYFIFLLVVEIVLVFVFGIVVVLMMIFCCVGYILCNCGFVLFIIYVGFVLMIMFVVCGMFF